MLRGKKLFTENRRKCDHKQTMLCHGEGWRWPLGGKYQVQKAKVHGTITITTLEISFSKMVILKNIQSFRGKKAIYEQLWEQFVKTQSTTKYCQNIRGFYQPSVTWSLTLKGRKYFFLPVT